MLAAVAALASDGVAVDFQSVHKYLRMRAIRFGALPVRTVMPDQGAVAVRSTGQAFAAFVSRHFFYSASFCSAFFCSAISKHGLLLTPHSATAQLPRRS
jgi:hypothetical protein